MKRIVVFAYSLVGHSCLQRLIDRGENVVGVFTHADDPNEHIWFGSVAELAEQNSIPVFRLEDPTTSEFYEQVKDLKPDLILSFYYRFMLPQKILDLAPLGAFNMHGSLLPKYRGRVPINWAIIHGEPVTGATLHRMVASADAGDIIDQEIVRIHALDNAAFITISMGKAAVDILDRQLDNLTSGKAQGIPQKIAEFSYFGRRKPDDGIIDWTKSPWEIHNLIRALAPYPHYPGAFTFYESQSIRIMGDLIRLKDIPSPNSDYLSGEKHPYVLPAEMPMSKSVSQTKPGEIMAIYEMPYAESYPGHMNPVVRVACHFTEGKCLGYIDLSWVEWRDQNPAIDHPDHRHQEVISALSIGHCLGGSVSALHP